MKRSKIILWCFILAITTSCLLVYLLGKKVNPILLRYSKVEAKRFGVYVINSSLNQDFLKGINDDIFTTVTNSNGEVQMIDFKSKEVNYLLQDATTRIQTRLVELENGNIKNLDLANTFRGMKFKEIKSGVVCELPMGALFSNSIIANNGPVFPIKLNFIGDVITNLKTKVESYGINNVFLEVSIQVEVEERITMPQFTDSAKISMDVPLIVKVIQGNIPNYYLSALEKSSPIFSLPIS